MLNLIIRCYMTIWVEIYDDPIFFGSSPGFVNRTQSDSSFVNPDPSGPIESGFCQSDPIRSSPGFVNALGDPLNFYLFRFPSLYV